MQFIENRDVFNENLQIVSVILRVTIHEVKSWFRKFDNATIREVVLNIVVNQINLNKWKLQVLHDLDDLRRCGVDGFCKMLMHDCWLILQIFDDF